MMRILLFLVVALWAVCPGSAQICLTGRQMGLYNSTIANTGLFDIATTVDTDGNVCKQAMLWSVAVNDVPNAPWAKTTPKNIPKSESSECYGVAKNLILDTVPQVDPAEIDWILSYMNFGPPSRPFLLESLIPVVARMKSLDLGSWMDQAVGCLQDNEMITQWMCELAENPGLFGIPATTPNVNGEPITPTPKYAQWTAQNYKADQSLVDSGDATEGQNDFARTIKRVVHFAVVIDSITQAVRDIPDTASPGDTAKRHALMKQIWHATNANYPSGWERTVLLKHVFNVFLVAKKHSVDPAYEGIMNHAAGSLQNRLRLDAVDPQLGLDEHFGWNCCSGASDPQELLLKANILEAVVSDKAMGKEDNAKAGWALIKEIVSNTDLSLMWANMYESWNLAFTARLDAAPFLMSKLLIPSVACERQPATGDPTGQYYMGPRVIALYLSVYGYMLMSIHGNNKYDTMFHANAIQSTKATDRLGAINRMYAEVWRAGELAEVSGTDETAMGMKQLVLTTTTPTGKCIMPCLLGLETDTCKKCGMENHDENHSLEFNAQALADYSADSFGGRLLLRLFGRDKDGSGTGKYSLLHALDIEVGEEACTKKMMSFQLCFSVPNNPTTRPPSVATPTSAATTTVAPTLLDPPAATATPGRQLRADEMVVEPLSDRIDPPTGFPNPRVRKLQISNVWADVKVMAKQAGSTIMETDIKMPVMEQLPMKFPDVPLPVPLAEFKEKIIASYQSKEFIPKGMTGADLLKNNGYLQGKIDGIAAALNISPKTVKILGFELQFGSTPAPASRRQLLRQLVQLAETQEATVKTDYEVAAVDEKQAAELSGKSQSPTFAEDVEVYTEATMPPPSQLGFKHDISGTQPGAARTSAYVPQSNLTAALFVPGYTNARSSSSANASANEKEEDDLVMFLLVGGGILVAFVAGVAVTCLLLVKRGSKLAPEWVEDYVEQKGLI